jgi:hypothetical protein
LAVALQEQHGRPGLVGDAPPDLHHHATAWARREGCGRSAAASAAGVGMSSSRRSGRGLRPSARLDQLLSGLGSGVGLLEKRCGWGRACQHSGQIPPPWAWWENEAPTARAACGPRQASAGARALRRRAAQGRSPGIDVPPYAARCRFVRRLSVRSGRKRQGVARSLPLPIYSALGGLRQDPGRVAQSPAEARTCGNQGVAKYVCSCRRVGLAGRRTAGGARGAVAGIRCGGVGVRATGLRGAAGRKATLLNGGFHD